MNMFYLTDLTTLLIWVVPIVATGYLIWDWGADWYEEFRHEDDEYWESLTDETKQALQQQVESQGKRLDEHEKRIDALDDTAITVAPKNDKKSGSGRT